MVSPYADTHAHEHEWEVRRGDDGLVYEDGALYIVETCIYAEEKCVGTSERLDESFYETMYECEAVRSNRFDLQMVEVAPAVYDKPDGSAYTTAAETLSTGADAFEIAEDLPISLFERIEAAAAERLTDGAAHDDGPQAVGWFDHEKVYGGPHDVTVNVDGTRYRLTYKRTSQDRLD